MSLYIPRVYQRPISKFIVDTPRCNVYCSMGVGKTPAVLDALADLFLFGEIARVLVLAPKRVAQSTWPGEIEKFRGSFGHLTYAVAVGDAATRRTAVESSAQLVFCNYENLEWLVENYGETWNFDTVICDESTRISNLRVSIRTSKSGKKFLSGQGGTRAKALARVALTKVKRFINISGTPAPNGLDQLWGQAFFLDSGRRLGSSYSAFSNRWFAAAPGSTPQRQQLVPLPYADEQIRAAIRDITIAVEAKDHFDLPPLIENILLVELPSAARSAYRAMEKELFALIEGNAIEAFDAGSKSQKCLQIAAGATYTDDKGNWVEVHDSKLDALRSVMEEAAGMPVLVFYHFKSDLARIQKAFPKAKHLGANPKTIDEWNAGRIPMLLAHPQSAGHGLSLQHGSNICCFFTTSWSLEADSQAIERLGPTRQAQSGYKRPVFVHRIVAKGTLDEAVVARLKTKASVQDALMQAMKHKC